VRTARLAAPPLGLALGHLRGLGLAPGSRVLALSDDPATLEAALTRERLATTSIADVEGTDLPAESFDAAVIAGALERREWDRWTLQEVHRLLKPDAVLVLVVPALASPAALLDFSFLAASAPKLAARLARRLGLPPTRAPRFRVRRYRSAALRGTLAQLGFLELASARAKGGPASGHLAIVARRSSSLYGDPPRRPWPEPRAFQERFERDYASFLATRDRWAADHRELLAESPQEVRDTAELGGNVLVLAPHPDDELLGCGGTLARIARSGGRVTILHATDGSEAASLQDCTAAVRRTVRLEEAKEVARAMGFDPPVLWRESNASFVESPGLVDRLAQLIEDLDPQGILLPFVTDIHPDHRVLCRLLARALDARPSRAWIWSYSGWSLVPPNRFCDVTDSFDAVEDAFRLYRTAMKVEDYVHMAEDRCYYNACKLIGRPRLAEAFHRVPASIYAGLVATGERDRG